MTISRDSIAANCVYPIIEITKGEFSRGSEIKLEEASRIYSEDGPLDSIELVRLIILLEEKVRSVFGKEIRLSSVSALVEGKTPFSTLGELIKFIELKLNEKS